MVPALRRVDAIPALAVAATTVITWPWLRVGSDARALAALLPGWDNAAHFDMANLLAGSGVMVDRLGPAPGNEAWQFDDYPQGYHAVVATVMEVLGVDGAAQVVAPFVRAQAVVLVVLAGMLAAAVCSLPRLRRRPAYALPLAALLVGAFVGGVGAGWVTAGFPNFVLACGLAACVPLLVATMPRVAMPWQVGALGALLVGVANAWVMLLAAAAPAALALVLPRVRSRWRAPRRDWVVTGIIATVTLAGLVVPLRLLLTSLDAQTVLTTPGGFAAPDLGTTVALALGAAALCLLGGRGGSTTRAWQALAPVVALAACGVLGLWQLRTDGGLSYYFFKLLGGVQLFSLGTLVLGLSGLTPPVLRGGLRRAAAVSLATLAASQLTGFTGSGMRSFAVKDVNIVTAEALLAASQVPSDALRTTFLAPQLPAHALGVQQWYLALTGRWTREANADAAAVLGGATPPDLATAVPALLTTREPALVVVPPATLDAARAAAGGAGAGVVSW